jgi:hypothetical protein
MTCGDAVHHVPYTHIHAQAAGTGRTTVVKVDGAGVVVDEKVRRPSNFYTHVPTWHRLPWDLLSNMTLII